MCSSGVIIETPVIIALQAPCTHIHGIIHQAQCQHGLQKEEVVHVERALGHELACESLEVNTDVSGYSMRR